MPTFKILYCAFTATALLAVHYGVGIFNIIFIFIVIFACRPPEYVWTRHSTTPHEGSCDTTLFVMLPTYFSIFLNVLADWILPLLPITLVWKTRMAMRKKIPVCAVIALGSL